MAADDILTTLGLERLITRDAFETNAAGHFVDSMGTRVVLISAETTRGFHRVIEAEEPGAWSAAMKGTGSLFGSKIAAALDSGLEGIGKPSLAALPLEACLALLEHNIGAYGWGRLKVDLTDAADHGFVVARLDHSYHAEALADSESFVDPLLAGVLQGFFGHISGQNLGCEEIACARHGSPQCTFVITAPERLATIRSWIGHESADTLLARLRQ